MLDIADASGSSFQAVAGAFAPSNDDSDGGGGNEAHRLIPQTRMTTTMIKAPECQREQTLESDCLGLKASSASHWPWESGGRLTSLCPASSSIKWGSVPNYGMCLDGCLTRDRVLTSYGSSYFIDIVAVGTRPFHVLYHLTLTIL